MKTDKSKSNWVKKRLIILTALILFVAGFFVFLIYRAEQVVAPVSDSESQIVVDGSHDEQPEPADPEPLADLQPVVDEWLKTSRGEYSIVIRDLEADKLLARHRQDEPYFTASIYKLYIAYLGYMDLQAGLHQPTEPFLGEWDRAKCLDEMIRTSHSPCAEKLWVEQGKEAATARLMKLGLKDTSLAGLTTTAADTDILLKRLYDGEDLDTARTEMLLDSMKEQIYRDALTAGAKDLVVANKVGFREEVEYHDVGIITLKSGRQVAISVYSKNAGPGRIADLTRTVVAALDE